MAKKQKSKNTTKTKEQEMLISDDPEYKSTIYVFLFTLIGAIIFLLIYLIGLINILLK